MGNKKNRNNSTMVDITKLKLGFEMRSGHVVIGVPDSEGVIDTEHGIAADITEDFFLLVNQIMEIQAAAKKLEADKKPKIILTDKFGKPV